MRGSLIEDNIISYKPNGPDDSNKHTLPNDHFSASILEARSPGKVSLKFSGTGPA